MIFSRSSWKKAGMKSSIENRSSCLADKKHILILGGGISGLSLAYYLRKKFPSVKITLLEKNNRLGGVIETIQGPYFFEKGPRTFRTTSSRVLLALIQELNLEGEIAPASRSATSRYLCLDGALHALPKSPIGMLKSPLIQNFWKTFFKEIRAKKGLIDETVYDFALRRFGKYYTETFFDPLILGIYAGDIKKLSIRMALPFFKELEDAFGSIFLGLLKRKKNKEKPLIACLEKASLFSMKNGLSTLVNRLQERINCEILTSFDIEKVDTSSDQVVVHGKGLTVEGDVVFSALPFPVTKKLFSLPFDIDCVSISCVHLGYRQNVLSKDGFGYLVPSKEREDILGCVFDSSIFPSQNQKNSETRLTVMIKNKDPSALVETAKNALKKHLKVDVEPDFVSISPYENFLPQYELAHENKMLALQNRKSYFVGNYLSGVSVNDCIKTSKKMAEQFCF